MGPAPPLPPLGRPGGMVQLALFPRQPGLGMKGACSPVRRRCSGRPLPAQRHQQERASDLGAPGVGKEGAGLTPSPLPPSRSLLPPQTKCFICGIGSDYFDTTPHGFDTHTLEEHNLANYM